MPNPTVGSEVDAFYPQIRRRLIESGEWDRIRTALYNKLNECGWADSVKDECKERMRSSPDLSAKDLLHDLAANSHPMPHAIRREFIRVVIRQCIEKQFE